LDTIYHMVIPIYIYIYIERERVCIGLKGLISSSQQELRKSHSLEIPLGRKIHQSCNRTQSSASVDFVCGGSLKESVCVCVVYTTCVWMVPGEDSSSPRHVGTILDLDCHEF